MPVPAYPSDEPQNEENPKDAIDRVIDRVMGNDDPEDNMSGIGGGG